MTITRKERIASRLMISKNCSSREKTLLKKEKGNQLISGEKEHALAQSTHDGHRTRALEQKNVQIL